MSPDDAPRPRSDRAYLVATIVGFVGCLAAVVTRPLGAPGELDAIPTALGGFALVLAIAGWVHERGSRWRTAEALGAAAAAVVIGPVLAWIHTVGWLIGAAALVAFVLALVA